MTLGEKGGAMGLEHARGNRGHDDDKIRQGEAGQKSGDSWVPNHEREHVENFFWSGQFF
jgi:hypothetical protein